MYTYTNGPAIFRYLPSGRAARIRAFFPHLVFSIGPKFDFPVSTAAAGRANSISAKCDGINLRTIIRLL